MHRPRERQALVYQALGLGQQTFPRATLPSALLGLPLLHPALQ